MTQEEKQRWVFASIDKDGDGVATAEEIKAALTRACVPDPAAETTEILQGKEAVTFHDFKDLEGNEPFYSLAMFAFIDTNTDGKVTKAELSESVAKLDGFSDISKLFAEMDTDNDGLVNYAEMKAYFSKK